MVTKECQLPLTGLELKEQGKKGYAPEPVAERFWRHVDVDGDCWLWLGHKGNYGYGRFALGHLNGKRTKTVSAARWAYEYTYGPIPEGLEPDHLCRTPSCVNPEHLETVTHAENMRRGKNANVTHCPQGHEYNEANTKLYQGRRFCRACARQRDRRYRREIAGRLA